MFHGNNYAVGYSDTFWWGRDHFTPCFHVVGVRGVANFTPVSHKPYLGELRLISFREDPAQLPAQSMVNSAEDKATSK